MFAKIRSLTKQTAVYGVGTIAARAVAFLLLPYYSHLLSPAEYGVYALFMVLVTLLQPLYIHGMDIALLRFSAAAERQRQGKDLGGLLVQTLFIGGSLSLVLVSFAPDVARMVVSNAGATEITITRISAGVLLLDALSLHIFTWLRIGRRPLAFSLVKLLNVIVNIGLNVWLVGGLKMGVLGAFYAFLWTSITVLAVLLILALPRLSFEWRWGRMREWFLFGLPNLPSQLFMVAVEFSDRKWIEHFLGVDEAGIYSAGYRIAMLMNMVAQAFRYAWQPFFLQTANDEDARETFARVFTYYLLFVGWIWLAGSFFLAPLLKLPLPGIGPLIAPDYWAGFAVIPIVMLAHVFNGMEANFIVGVYIEKKTKIIPVVIGIAAAVNIVGNGLLVPVYGYMASAWLTVASYVVIAGGVYVYIHNRYRVPYEWSRVMWITLSVAAAFALGAMLLETAAGLIVRGILTLGLPVLWIRFILTPAERSGFVRWWKQRFGAG